MKAERAEVESRARGSARARRAGAAHTAAPAAVGQGRRGEPDRCMTSMLQSFAGAFLGGAVLSRPGCALALAAGVAAGVYCEQNYRVPDVQAEVVRASRALYALATQPEEQRAWAEWARARERELRKN